MAKGGKHLAPKQKTKIRLTSRKSEKNAEAPEPKTVTELAGEEEQQEKRGFKKPDGEKLKAFLKKLLSPRRKKKKVKREKPTINGALSTLLKLIIAALFCVFMITPLKSCVFSDEDFVPTAKVEQIAFEDSGVKGKEAGNKTIDLIKIDEQPCYKFEFTYSTNGYKYIINAETGDIVAQSIYRIDTPQKED